MTKTFAKLLFSAYHAAFGSRNITCRFQPTCSLYAYQAISKYGFIKGGILAVKRLISCHPLSKRPIYDPIPDAYAG